MATRRAVSCCSGCNQACPRAEGFKLTTESTESFVEKVRSYWSKAGLPASTETVNWRVYLLKPSAKFHHHSLLVQCDESECSFTLELIVVNGKVVPKSSLFTSKNPQRNYPCLGSVTATANNLFEMALRCLERFGDYHYMTHNCQDYCKVYSIV